MYILLSNLSNLSKQFFNFKNLLTYKEAKKKTFSEWPAVNKNAYFKNEVWACTQIT